MFNLWGHEGVKAQLPSCWGVPTPAVLKISYNKGTDRASCCSTAGCSWHVSHGFPTGLGRTAAEKASFISSHSFQGLSGAESQSSDIQREKNRWVPSLAAELAARDNACSGSFCNKHGEVGTGVFSSLLLKLPFLSIFQARRGYLSWQPWKSSTIWCLYVCRGSTEGFSVTDEICSPSNTPAKEILPLESQTIRFLLQRCLIPGNWVLWEN